VLVAVPDEADPTPALTYAVAEADRCDTELHLVRVFQAPSGPDGADREDLRRAEALAEHRLAAVREQAERLAGDRVKLETRLLHGPVVPTLVDASADAGVVVLQRRDLRLVERVLSRSTSSGVTARAHVPVVTVPARWRGDTHDRVTVGLDELDRCGPLLREALDDARRRGAVLRVVHTWWFAGGYDDVLRERADYLERTARTRREVEEAVTGVLAGDPGVRVELDLRHERPADALVAASDDSDLVVIGRHDPLVPVGSHLGPVARAVLRESACPVLVVGPGREHRRED
jgi:nucleotide-binding universal stress UspA family protein